MADAISVSKAATHYLNSLGPDKAQDERPQVEHFVKWTGTDREVASLTSDDIRAFAASEQERHGGASPDPEPVRGFLAYCSRLAFTSDNLVPFLGLPGGGVGGARGDAAAQDLGGNAYYVTLEGLAALEREVEELKGRRPEIAEQLRAAMADKDFRENAPLDAARDAQAHLEARIRAIEDQLRHAVIIDPDQKAGRANVGSTVRVLNLKVNREQTFHLVSPNEVDPSSGKISVESPVGQAVIHHGAGDEVTVNAPSGELQLRVLEVIG
jgi:transcription elongation factor GreA